MSRIQELVPNTTLLSTNWSVEAGNGASVPANHHTALSDKKPKSTRLTGQQWTRIWSGTALNSNFRAGFSTYTLDTNERCRRLRLVLIGHTTASRVRATVGNGASASEPLGAFELRRGSAIVEWLYGPWVTKGMTAGGAATLEWGQAEIDDLRMRLDPIASGSLGDCGVYEAYVQLDVVEKPAPLSISPFEGEVFPTTTPILRWSHSVPEVQKKFDLRIFPAHVAEDSSFDPMTSTQYIHRSMQSTSVNAYRVSAGVLEHGQHYYVYLMTAVDFNGEDWWSDWDEGTAFKINAKPVVSVIAPISPVPDTAKPVVQWAYDDEEGDLQSAFRVIVIQKPGGGWPGTVDPEAESLAGNAIHDSGMIASGNTDYTIPVALVNTQQYRAYVQVQQRVPSVLNSDWSYIQFDMQFASPPAPTVVASPAGEAADVTIFPTHPNLLSADVSSLEAATGTWQAGTNTTLTRVLSPSNHGFWSLAMDRTVSTGDITAMTSLLTTGQTPVAVGQTYTAQASFRTQTTGRLCRVGIEWINSANASLGITQGEWITDTTPDWRQAFVTAVAPTNAVNARVVVTVAGAAVSERHYVDSIQFNHGGLGAFNSGGGTIGVTLDAVGTMHTYTQNRLTDNQASLETNTAGWLSSGGSTTIARSTAQALQGTASLSLTRNTTTGDAIAVTNVFSVPIMVHPGREYSALASFRAATTGRLCQLTLVFYDDGGLVISGVAQNRADVTDNTTGWAQATVRAVAPHHAVSVQLELRVVGAVATEVHYVDAIGVSEGVVTTWVAGRGYALNLDDMELTLGITMIDWMPDEDACLVHRWDFENDQDCSWALWLLTTGHLRFDWSLDGSAATAKSATSTAPLAIAAGTLRWLRLVFDNDNGASGQNVSFFQGATKATATTAVGANPVTVATVEAIYDGSAELVVGGPGMAGGGWNGYVTEVEMKNAVTAGTVLANGVANIQPIGIDMWMDAQGNTWMLDETAELEMREKPNPDYFNVERSRDGGTTWEHFRYDTGMLFSNNVPKSLLPFVMRDHEVPVNQMVMYRAEAVSVGLGFDANSPASLVSNTTVVSEVVWVKDCLDSSRNRHFKVSDKWLSITHNRNRKVYQPLGRARPVVIKGSGLADSMAVSFLITSREEHEVFHSLIDGDNLLFLQTPKGSWWVECAADMNLRSHLWDTLRNENDVYIMTVPFQEVDRLTEAQAVINEGEAGSGHGGGH